MAALIVLDVPNFPRFPRVNPLAGDRVKTGNPLLRMWQSVKRQIVDDVPEALATCQFDCGRAQCLRDSGGVCERPNRKGSGELFWASPLQTAAQFRVFRP
jgi:hypothetical protein